LAKCEPVEGSDPRRELIRQLSDGERILAYSKKQYAHMSERKMFPAAVLFPALFCLWGGSIAYAQLSASAYRVLGQPDMQRNVRNQIGGSELRTPYAIATDHRDGVTRLYVVDSSNNRVLAWSNAQNAARGEQADFVLGQPNFQQAVGLGVSGRQLGFPTSIAVDPTTGDLYVADTGANRVVRFKNPFDQGGAAEPNAVFGQPNFTTITVNTGGLSASSMRTPRSVAVDGEGNLWVADSDNNRVLRYPVSALAAGVRTPAADLALGQTDFVQGGINRGGLSASSLRTPSGLAFDGQGRLYVCDTGNGRLLVFSPPFSTGMAASSVLGQPNFTTAVVPATPTANSLRQPTGVSIDPNLNLVYVTSPADQRVLMYRGITSGSAPAEVLGQPNLTSFQGNHKTAPRAGAEAFLEPFDVKVDPATGRVFIADTGNNRILGFDRGAKEASAVWVAVGTAIADRPPHRSVRALLTHTALTSNIWRRIGHRE
jgi:DNA-binding beta-propeller fold protein YncE